MSKQRDRSEVAADAERIRSAFVDAAPRTAEDVAAATGVDVEGARARLELLVEDGAVVRRTVSGVDITARKAAEAADIDTDEPIVLYHLPADALASFSAESPTADDEVGRRLERMVVPGSSDLMRRWQRDAVRGAYDLLVEGGGASPDHIREAVYPSHEAGFDDSEEWWRFVRPRLYRLPGVAVEDGEWFVEQYPRPRER